MTQALQNNFTNANQMFADKVNENSLVTTNEFQQLLDKHSDIQQEKTGVLNAAKSSIKTALSGTLGALKDIQKNSLAEFTDLLADVTGDVANESALDLTLIKNAEDIINNLQNENDNDNVEDAQEVALDETFVNNTNELGIIDTAIQTVVQNSAQPLMNEIAEDVNLLDDELTVTLNGKDLDSVLQDFGLKNNVEEDLLLTNPSEVDEVADTEGKTLDELVDEDTLKELNVESVEAETPDNGENSDLMKNQTPEEQGVKALLNSGTDFADVKLDAKPEISTQTTKPVNSNDVTPSKIIEQISKQLENMNTGSKVNIVLNPESLGKVSVQLINTNEGLSAQFTVASQDARNLIMKGLDGLKDALAANGVSVDNVSVKLNDTQESEHNADWTEQEGSRGGNKEQGSQRGQKEEQEFEEKMSFAQNEEN